MGYHVTILRTSEKTKIPISLEEAISATRGLDGWSHCESPPTLEFQGMEGSCTLWHQDGELWTKNPEEWQLGVMVALAQRLGARVRGDEGETYDSMGDTFGHPDDISLGQESGGLPSEVAASMQEQRLIRNVIVGFFIVLAVVGYAVGKWLER